MHQCFGFGGDGFRLPKRLCRVLKQKISHFHVWNVVNIELPLSAWVCSSSWTPSLLRKMEERGPKKTQPSRQDKMLALYVSTNQGYV